MSDSDAGDGPSIASLGEFGLIDRLVARLGHGRSDTVVGAGSLTLLPTAPTVASGSAAVAVAAGSEVYVSLEGLVDFVAERKRVVYEPVSIEPRVLVDLLRTYDYDDFGTHVIPEAIKTAHPEIPWPRVIGMRNRLVHGYDVIDYDLLWDTVVIDLPPLIAALTQSSERLVEYAGHDGHARFVAQELPAQLEHDFPLHSSPAARGLMGASFGGVASLHAAWRHPGAFGRLVLQSAPPVPGAGRSPLSIPEIVPSPPAHPNPKSRVREWRCSSGRGACPVRSRSAWARAAPRPRRTGSRAS